MKYFRLEKAFGGLANDGDKLCVDLKHDSQDDLPALFEDLAIQP